MHIPEHMMGGPICPVTATLSVAVISGAVFFALKTKHKPNPFRFAAITALIFAAQMLNFPVQDGTSGHLIGTSLAILLLGPPFGILSQSIVLTIQCLIFADGGLAVLGANIFNMAVLAAIPSIIYYLIIQKELISINPIFRQLLIFFTSWLSVIFAATGCATELALSQVVSAEKVFPAMLSIHALIGVGEGLITVALVSILGIKKIAENKKLSIWIPALGAIIVALLLSPLASSFPDGLEWVAGQLDFLHEGAPLFVSPLADYVFPGLDNDYLATGLAGLVGVAIILGIISLIGLFEKLLRTRNAVKGN